MFVVAVVLARRIGSPRAGAFVSVGVGAWLVFTAMLALRGTFREWEAMPPRLVLVLVPSLLMMAVLAFVTRGVHRVPPAWLIAPQAFRLLIEIVLTMLYTAGLLPELMTFHGRNFDIFIGLTAIPVALLARRMPRLAIVWNVVGIALLVNVMTHGLLSAPTPLRVFMTEPANTFVGYFPFIWIATFLIPFAMLLHILSIKQLRKISQ
jgi:hypothetical protein